MKRARIMAVVTVALALGAHAHAAGEGEALVGIVSYWKLNEGSDVNVYDYISSYDGTINGAQWIIGEADAVLGFDGKDDCVRTTLNIDQSGATDITMAAWVYPTSTSWGRHQVISSDNGGFDWSLLREGSKWHAFVGDGSWNSGFTVDINKWQHVVVVFRVGEDVIFYKNAVSSSKGSAPATDTRDNDIAIGDNPAWYREYFSGIITDVMILDKSLSSEEVQELYQNGLIERGLAPELEIIGVDNVELAIYEKLEALEKIEIALEKQQAAYDTLGLMLEKAEYGNLGHGEIVAARDELHSAIEKDELTKRDLAESVRRLENAFAALGFEVE